MLDALRFIRGAISSKDWLPAMQHFVIENNTVRSYNGTMALSSPIDTALQCVPKAVPLLKALEACADEISLSLTPSDRLKVQSGKFKAFIECLPSNDVPHMTPAGQFVKVNGAEWLKAFQTLFPFIGEDASRPFTNGILLRGQSAYATNNVIVIEYWIGESIPIEVNIPQSAIREIVRIGQPIDYLQVDERSISFHYAEGKWLRTQLLTTEWPDVEPILNRPAQLTDIDARIFEGLDALQSFSDDSGRVYFDTDVMRTDMGDGVGAAYELAGSTVQGCYQAKLLRLLERVAERAGFGEYPSPCMFTGQRIRGAMSSMVMPGIYAPRAQ